MMSKEKRSYVMSRIRSTGTRPERMLGSALHGRGFRYRKHVKGLPGRPDLVFAQYGVVVFVDGDFWHGWQFPRWESKLKPYWRQKIAGNRARDRRQHQALRRLGWRVMRVWEHEINRDVDAAAERVSDFLLRKPAD